jgi:hypothetical protein
LVKVIDLVLPKQFKTTAIQLLPDRYPDGLFSTGIPAGFLLGNRFFPVEKFLGHR